MMTCPANTLPTNRTQTEETRQLTAEEEIMLLTRLALQDESEDALEAETLLFQKYHVHITRRPSNVVPFPGRVLPGI